MHGLNRRPASARIHRTAPPTAFTADLLTRGIAYRQQELAHGRLAIEHRRELDRLAGGGKPKGRSATGVLRPGNRLVRRWRGITFTVAVVENGFLYDDQKYRSLSEIARVITGTRWSGPRFFGCAT
ncbi:MAG: DUF2924 domain-containing protein [Sphingomicrobium sp.]